MGKDLTDTERAIIQQVILDRWNPLRLNKKIADGRVEFFTKWPGWYSNRTVHVHFTVQLASGPAATSQLYFPENLNDDVLAQPPYSNRGMRNRRNDNDPVLRSRDLDALQMTVIPTAIGYRAWHTIGIRS